ncbi:MAG TPA: EAL domain-containing protein [Steroidobacteraceae bacterium]|nr:EAL domain-containing protein [Steroidobacteraceae bacterium]
MSNWLRSAHSGITHRRSVLIAGCGVPFAALVILYILNQRGWQEQAQSLRRENLSLQVRELTSSVEKEFADLDSAARTLAESEGMSQWVQDEAGQAPAEAAHLDASAARLELSTVAVATAGQSVRFSAVLDGGRLVEHSPDPGEIRYLSGVAARTATDSAALPAAMIDDRLIAARPIAGRTSSAPIGWVIVTRRVSPAMLARLQRSVSGELSGRSFRQFDRSAAPADVRDWLGSKTAAQAAISTEVSGDRAAYALLRDASGQPAWVFQLVPRGAAAATAGPRGLTGLRAGRSLTLALLAFAVLLAAAFAAAAVYGVKAYLRHRRSVDSRYKAIIDQTNDGIVIVDAESLKVQYCNPAFLARIGYSESESGDLTLADIFADAGSSPDTMLERLKDADPKRSLDLQLRCKGGTLVDIEVRCNPLEADGREGFAYVTHDVSVRRKAEQQLIDNQQRLDRMAHHDQLTGLPNRHHLATFLPEAIADARAANTMLGVVFLDLDRFKHINDTRGHETGDKLLQEVARRLRTCVRDSDVVIRMGGDEFVVVFRNVKSYDEVTLGANRIIESLNKPIVIDQHPLQTTGSVGVSLFPRDGADMGELLKHSDTAMYQAKDRGRNNVQMFSQIMNRKLKHRVAMEASIRDALRLKQLDVHYQPFVSLITRKVVGLEALIRWKHPVHGMIPADQFIPVAEETGLIVPMGNFVLHRTLQTLSAWQKAGVSLVPVSLNVAPAQLQRGDLQSTIATLLKTHGLKPDLLQLEMTERAVFDSHQAKSGENRQDTMVQLRDLGVKIAIDDFGTGYSSLSYLKNWRVDALKIDRSFVRDLVTDSSDLAIVSAIIAIARHLHIQVIAEGIEAYQQAEILLKLGCTVGQGFLFARPMPADQCLALLGSDAQPAEEEDMLAVFASGRA